MRALILTAGHGTRLRPLTYLKPKVMIDVAGKPVLEHQIKYLNTYGIKNIVVNLHYMPAKVMSHFGTRLLYFYEPKLLGEEETINQLVKEFPMFTEQYLTVVNGDTLTNLNLDDMFRMAKGFSVRHMEGNVYAGVKILSPAYLTGKSREINNYYSSNTWWCDMGTPKGLVRARREFKKNEKESDSLSKLS